MNASCIEKACAADGSGLSRVGGAGLGEQLLACCFSIGQGGRFTYRCSVTCLAKAVGRRRSYYALSLCGGFLSRAMVVEMHKVLGSQVQ